MSSYQHIRYAPQDYQFVVYEVADKIARITLNRPEQVNVQSTALLEELDHAIDAAGADPSVRVICLFGAGRHFSAGHDLGSPEETAHREQHPPQDGTRGVFERNWRLYVDMHLRWRNVPKPMICAVQGYCIYGGWMVASTADFIFAADDALFLGSAFQYFSIPYDIHHRMAKELLFQSRFIDARQAKALGLVNRVIAPERLVAETLEYAADVASNDPFDLRATKLAINQALDAQGFTACRWPMVQVALERYQRDQQRRQGGAGEQAAPTEPSQD